LAGERDIVAKGAAVQRLDARFRWPQGKRVAVLFNLALEAWSEGKGPGIGPMGNPLPAGHFDTNALSWGNYGGVRGIWRLLESLARHQIKASVMVSGVLAERRPETVKAIASAGHEIVAHAFAQDVIPATLSDSEVREDIARTTRALADAAGSTPRGWISPRGTPNVISAQALADAGYLWHGDAFDDDLPYLQRFGERSIVAIPLTMDVNDLPHALRYGNSPREFVALFREVLDRARTREAGATMIDVTAHAHVFGRPSGAGAFEAVMELAKASPELWIGTRSEVAQHVIGALAKT
jgi:peptidoglycan/xylan/chitin deacetylase (PgdA/CDA1 family)